MADFLSGFHQAVGLQHVATEQAKLGVQQEALAGTLKTEQAKQDREYAQSLLEARKQFANDPMKLMQIDQQLWPRLQLQPLSPTQWMEYLPAIQEAYAAYDRKDMKTVGEILMQRLPPSVTEGMRRQQAFENIGQASGFPAGSGEAIAASPQLQQQAGQRITEPKMGLQADVAAGKPITEQQQIVAGVRQPYPTTEVTALQREQIEKNKADTALHQMTFSLMVRGLEFDRKAFRDDTKVASVMGGFEKKGISEDERRSLLSSATPESRAFSQNKDARLQQVTQSLDTLEDQASKLRLMQADFRTGQLLPQGYDANRVEAESAVTARMLAMKRAEKDWLDHPTASTFAKYQETRQEGERFIGDLENKIRLLGDERNVLQRGRLEIALRKEQYDTNVAQAQQEYVNRYGTTVDAGGAAAIAAKHGVKVSDMLVRDPNAPQTQVTIAAPGEREKLAAGEATVATLGHIKNLYKDQYVGWFDAKTGAIKERTGLISQEEAQFRAAVNRYEMEQTHRIYGAALTPNEIKRALKAIPNIGMSNVAFKASVAESKRWEEVILTKHREEISKANVQKQEGRPSGGKKSFDARYRELERSGMSKETIFSTLDREGY